MRSLGTLWKAPTRFLVSSTGTSDTAESKREYTSTRVSPHLSKLQLSTKTLRGNIRPGPSPRKLFISETSKRQPAGQEKRCEAAPKLRHTSVDRGVSQSVQSPINPTFSSPPKGEGRLLGSWGNKNSISLRHWISPRRAARKAATVQKTS